MNTPDTIPATHADLNQRLTLTRTPLPASRKLMQTGSQLRFRAGAGVVADSDPERELQETRHKARGLLRALGQ